MVSGFMVLKYWENDNSLERGNFYSPFFFAQFLIHSRYNKINLIKI